MSDAGTDVRRFPFRFSRSYLPAARLFGITPERAWVEVGTGDLEARYGRWQVMTTLENIAAVRITGPYRYVKTAGPPHLGVTDLGLTFAGNGDRGVELSFVRPVAGIEPWGLLRHPELTVTVADPDGLKALLSERLGL